ncbi:MAG: hypothetical protein OEM62_09930 [Acidobacteriota bacterium]|nr:hypothetical protein [Acidobacteriota bacterium]
MSDRRDQIFPGASGSRLPKIVLEFESFRDFIQAFSPVVSEEGMFVAADVLINIPLSLGEEVDFEVRLTDDFRLVHGRGDVFWTRAAAGPDGPAGTAIRFLDLDEPSRRLVSRLIANFAKDGGKPFALSQGKPASSSAAVEPELLERREADELFAPDPEGEVPEQEVLDSVAPSEDQETAAGAESAEPGLLEAESLPPLPEFDVEVPAIRKTGVEEFLLPPEGDAGEPAAEALAVPLGTGLAEEPEGVIPPSESDSLSEVLQAEEPSATLGSGSGVVIPDDIVQAAEELSGIYEAPPVEMPSDEDRMALAGAAKVKSTGRSWGTLVAASLAGITLGVAVWYFAGDQLKGWIGLGDGTGEAAVARVGLPPAAPMSDAESASAVRGAPGSDAEVETSPAESPDSVSDGAAGVARDEATESDNAPAKQDDEELAADSDEEPEDENTTGPVGPATAVERIVWRQEGASTVVDIRLNGRVGKNSYEVVGIRQGAPREVIKIFGIDSEFRPKQLEIDSPHIQRLRTGLHVVNARGELHIVADLTSADVAIESVQAAGRRLILTFS